MMLKPQDVALVLSVLVAGWPRTYADMAMRLGLSASEAHAATKRAVAAGLLHSQPSISVNRTALREFLIHGLKYVFPAERGPRVRGMPTSYAAPPLNSSISPGDEDVPVWPDPDGEMRGYELKPLYPSVPTIARRDPALYEWFALVDAIRSGRAREREQAAAIIQDRLHAG